MRTPPNILYINPDQMRADALACYGHPIVHTPDFYRLAAMGVRYEQIEKNTGPKSFSVSQANLLDK